MTEKTNPVVDIGDVWADNNPRMRGRTVRVDAIVWRCPRETDVAEPYAICTTLTPPDTSPQSRTIKEVAIRVSRMRPTSAGYRLISAALKGRCAMDNRIDQIRSIIADHCFGPHATPEAEERALDIASACTDDMIDAGLLSPPTERYWRDRRGDLWHETPTQALTLISFADGVPVRKGADVLLQHVVERNWGPLVPAETPTAQYRKKGTNNDSA